MGIEKTQKIHEVAVNKFKKLPELRQLEQKLESACQSGSKKSWRKYGKKVYLLRKELGEHVDPWMESTFGRLV